MKKFNEKKFEFKGYSKGMNIRFYALSTKKGVRAYVVPTSLSLSKIDMNLYEVSKDLWLTLYNDMHA